MQYFGSMLCQTSSIKQSKIAKEFNVMVRSDRHSKSTQTYDFLKEKPGNTDELKALPKKMKCAFFENLSTMMKIESTLQCVRGKASTKFVDKLF